MSWEDVLKRDIELVERSIRQYYLQNILPDNLQRSPLLNVDDCWRDDVFGVKKFHEAICKTT